MTSDEQAPIAFDDLSQVTQTVDFAYSEVDAHVFGVATDESGICGCSDVDVICDCQRGAWIWVFPYEKCELTISQISEFQARCSVACWWFIPFLRTVYKPAAAAMRFAVSPELFRRYSNELLAISAQYPDKTYDCLERVLRWVYQDGAKDLDGFLCRCIIAAWVFVPTLAHAYSMTGIASRFGKKKQSIERWTKDFKREFPTIAAHHPHLKHNTH